MKYPIVCVLGEQGAGKTLLMTAIAESYFKEGVPVFANYNLFRIKYDYMDFKTFIANFERLQDCAIFLDEIQRGADAYDHFKPDTREVTKFATQIRKRHIMFYYSTQDFSMVPKRLRKQTRFIMQVTGLKEEGTCHIAIYRLPFTEIPFREFVFDGSPYFDGYDTDEMIDFEDVDAEALASKTSEENDEPDDPDKDFEEEGEF